MLLPTSSSTASIEVTQGRTLDLLSVDEPDGPDLRLPPEGRVGRRVAERGRRHELQAVERQRRRAEGLLQDARQRHPAAGRGGDGDRQRGLGDLHALRRVGDERAAAAVRGEAEILGRQVLLRGRQRRQVFPEHQLDVQPRHHGAGLVRARMKRQHAVAEALRLRLHIGEIDAGAAELEAGRAGRRRRQADLALEARQTSVIVSLPVPSEKSTC